MEDKKDREWMRDARCRDVDTEVFFPAPTDFVGQAAAKLVCQDCPVKQPCLEYALAHNLQGIYGGTGQRERKRMTRRRIPVWIREG